MLTGSARCGLCGAPRQVAAQDLDWTPLRQRLPALRDRYGTLPLIASLGVLPFFPITPLAGIIGGVLTLFRIQSGTVPQEGRNLALLGLGFGLLWIILGSVFASAAIDWLSSFFSSLESSPHPGRIESI